MRVPPGLSRKDFSDALRKFEEAAGKEWVFTAEEDVDLYRDAYSPFWGEPEELVASAAVAPKNVEEVQKIVRAANEYGVPIYPISTGKNIGYGGSAPVYSGSVVLDLRRMNRVIEVNERNAYAVVEPGVSYFDLYRHIQEKGYKLWIDVPDPGWGSPMGNALDNGGGSTTSFYRNHFAAHCGMEIVLANGELLRTGMGAMPKAETWQQYKYGFGPMFDGLFKQSNFGVVTKMGFWLYPEPDAFLSGMVTAPRHNDVIPLVDILNYLENANVFNGMAGIGSPLLGSLEPPHPGAAALLAREGGAATEELESFALANGVPYWSANLRFYGPEKANRAQWDYAKEKLSAIPGAKFIDGVSYKFPLTPEEKETSPKGLLGIPNMSMLSLGARTKTNPNPTQGHVWFSPVVPRTGEGLIEANRVIRAAAKQLGLPVRLTLVPMGSWQRAFILLLAAPISHDAEANRKMRHGFREMIRICAEHGWGEYRTAAAFYDDVMDTYSFNNHIHRRVCETIKGALDPKGILSAGRYGIWPRHLRKDRA